MFGTGNILAFWDVTRKCCNKMMKVPIFITWASSGPGPELQSSENLEINTSHHKGLITSIAFHWYLCLRVVHPNNETDSTTGARYMLLLLLISSFPVQIYKVYKSSGSASYICDRWDTDGTLAKSSLIKLVEDEPVWSLISVYSQSFRRICRPYKQTMSFGIRDSHFQIYTYRLPIKRPL